MTTLSRLLQSFGDPVTAQASNDPFAPHMSAVARALLGEPNRAQSKQGQPRWGAKGSLSVDEERGVWFDHENDQGGGVLDLIKLQTGLAGQQALDWLKSNGCEVPNNHGNGSAAKPAKKEAVAEFDYVDADCHRVFRVVRFHFRNADGSIMLGKNGKPEKTFRCCRPNPTKPGQWIWDLDGIKPIPYRLPDVIESIRRDELIFIVEGEKKVDLLAKWDLCATCNSGGARKWTATHANYLRGACRVVILPDNDDSGRAHAEMIAGTLQGIVEMIQIVELPDLGPKDDLIEWAKAGGTRGKLHKLIDAAPNWKPQALDARPPEPPVNKPATGTEPDTAPTLAPAQDKPLILSSAAFLKGFVPPDYLIDGILQRRFLYSCTGKTGGGKTAAWLRLSAHVGLGLPLGRHEIEQGRVLYFAGENPDDVKMRWIALAEQMSFDPNTIPVHFIEGVVKISQLTNRICEEAKKIGDFALGIIDTSAAYYEGTEDNANVQQAEHGRRLRSLIQLPGGPTIIPLCHPAKNAGDDNLIPRGGGAFLAEVDGNLTCSNNDSVVELHWQGKFRGPDFAPIMFQLKTVTAAGLKDAKGRPIPTVVASPLSEAGHQELAKVARNNEDTLLDCIANNPGASLSDLAKLCEWFMRDGVPYKSMVNRIGKKLRDQKLVDKDRGELSLTDAGRKALAKMEQARKVTG